MPDNIKKFYKDTNCVVCGRAVKPWGRSHCDNCGGVVCNRHRPYFASYWQCPVCAGKQNQYLGNQSTQSQQNKTADHVTDQMRLAEKLIESGESEQADLMAADLLYYLYENLND